MAEINGADFTDPVDALQEERVALQERGLAGAAVNNVAPEDPEEPTDTETEDDE
jgi:hypothetical protein